MLRAGFKSGTSLEAGPPPSTTAEAVAHSPDFLKGDRIYEFTFVPVGGGFPGEDTLSGSGSAAAGA